MQIQPLGDRVIIKRSTSKQESGGIIIPAVAQQKEVEGKVIAVGDGNRNSEGVCQALNVSTGDHVLFSKYSGTEISIEGIEHVIVREDDILGIIK
jgi:chaperonin GroES